MQIADLRRTAPDRLLDFAWDEWAQMGVSAMARRTERSAQDPEALLLLTLEVAPADARLFGEVVDGLALNERLMSVQRLRNLCRDDADRTLAEAALAWFAHLTSPHYGPGRRLQRCPRLVAQRGGEPLAQPLGDVAPVEFKLRREMRDHFSHECSGHEQIHLDTQVVVENRLREKGRSAAVVAPFKALLAQIALIGERQRPLLPISDYADDAWTTVSVSRLRSADTDVSHA